MNKSICTASFKNHKQADEAINALVNEHINLKGISVIGQDYHTEEHPVGYVTTGDKAKTWGKVGGFWGAIWGLLAGSAIFIVPGIGAITAAGSLAIYLASGIEGAIVGGGLAAIIGGLANMGIPKEHIMKYKSAIEAGEFLVTIEGSQEETEKAKNILQGKETISLDIHPVEA
ncbi:MAG: general stress protein [Endozoicomonas sp.]|uniref:general stress protein n=1 Tax=Endozoicomonas sp. TaxID=1892382 RepID=UPI003D9B14BB